MEKVKVTRYVSGRRPEYAHSESESESSDEEEEEEGFPPVGGAEEEEAGEGLEVQQLERGAEELAVEHVEDRRLRRLRDVQVSASRTR